MYNLKNIEMFMFMQCLYNNDNITNFIYIHTHTHLFVLSSL